MPIKTVMRLKIRLRNQQIVILMVLLSDGRLSSLMPVGVRFNGSIDAWWSSADAIRAKRKICGSPFGGVGWRIWHDWITKAVTIAENKPA